jgi:hypothetical protein
VCTFASALDNTLFMCCVKFLLSDCVLLHWPFSEEGNDLCAKLSYLIQAEARRQAHQCSFVETQW